MDGLAAAAQDGGVAGFRAKDGGVAGDVGAGFVDDAHDADGHAAFGDFDAVGAGPGAEGFADGIGQRGDGADAVGHGGEAFFVEAQAVEHRAGKPFLCAASVSRALAARMAGAWRSSASAMASRPAFFCVRGQTRQGTRGRPGALAEGEDFSGEVHRGLVT